MVDAAVLRRGQQELARRAANDLAALWRQVSNAVEARAALDEILPALIRTYGEAAATLAADWYDEARLIADIGGDFTAIPASIDDSGTESLADWAVNKGSDLEAILALVNGGLSRRILNFSRQTVMGSALADPAADGWQRVGVGDSCKFCAMLIGRGAVYSEATVDFASHDWCNCAAVMAFRGQPRPVKPYKVSPRRTVGPDGKPVRDADFERAQAWIATHL